MFQDLDGRWDKIHFLCNFRSWLMVGQASFWHVSLFQIRSFHYRSTPILLILFYKIVPIIHPFSSGDKSMLSKDAVHDDYWYYIFLIRSKKKLCILLFVDEGNFASSVPWFSLYTKWFFTLKFLIFFVCFSLHFILFNLSILK